MGPDIRMSGPLVITYLRASDANRQRGWLCGRLFHVVAFQYYAPILGTSVGGLVIGHRLGFAVALGLESGRRHALVHQVLADRIRPALRQLQVVVVVAHAVGMAFDHPTG